MRRSSRCCANAVISSATPSVISADETKKRAMNSMNRAVASV